jgi:hypothetical protein
MAFETFEHRHIGNAAYDKVKKDPQVEKDIQDIFHFGEKPNCSRLGVPEERRGGTAKARATHLLCDVPLGFGDLSALAGDFVGSPDELATTMSQLTDLVRQLNDSKRPEPSGVDIDRLIAIRIQWLNACRWYGLSPGDRCFDGAAAIQGGRSYVATDLESADFESLPGYIDLAKKDNTHFPRMSWKQFIYYHWLALGEAAQYACIKYQLAPCKEANRKEQAEQHLKMSLIQEGWAQHFLQDSYASGHLGAPWGKCYVDILVLYICNPPRAILHQTHNQLNEIGIDVTTRGEALKNPAGSPSWKAFGDKNLFVKEATLHRVKVIEAASNSVNEILQAASGLPTSQKLSIVCQQWADRFPVPRNAEYRQEESGESLCPLGEDVPKKWTDTAVDVGRFADGRSVFPEAQDVLFEGWKIFGSLGPTFGKLDKLNQDGTLQTGRNSAPAGTLEMGYVRSTGEWYVPNFFGWGVNVIPGTRTSLYPISLGWWTHSNSGLFWGGIRLNAGARIEQPFLQENPSNRQTASFVTSLPLDLGLQIYPPLSIYVRLELLNVNFQGSPKYETPFNGQTYLGLGLAWDLGKVFRQ